MSHKPAIVETVVVTNQQIQTKLHELATKINKYYQDVKLPVACIGLLKGCFPFMSDILKLFTFPFQVHFIEINSYQGKCEKMRSGVIVSSNFESITHGSRVLIIDDIVQTGNNLNVCKKELMKTNPVDIKVVAMVTKQGHEKALDLVDWWGVQTPNFFLIGYGLDYNNQYRYLPYIAVADQDYIKKTKD